MTTETARHLIEDLAGLLDRERKALIGGDLEQLAEMMSRKAALIARINNLGHVDQADLVAVRDKVARNQTLLNSALDGIRAVAERMAELRRVRRGLETYGRDGRKARFDTATRSRVEKRA